MQLLFNCFNIPNAVHVICWLNDLKHMLHYTKKYAFAPRMILQFKHTHPRREQGCPLAYTLISLSNIKFSSGMFSADVVCVSFEVAHYPSPQIINLYLDIFYHSFTYKYLHHLNYTMLFFLILIRNRLLFSTKTWDWWVGDFFHLHLHFQHLVDTFIWSNLHYGVCAKSL